MSDDQETQEILEEIGITDSDFQYVDDEQGEDPPDTTAKIRLMSDPYRGTIIRYNRVYITPDPDGDGNVTMSFEYTICNALDSEKQQLEESSEFQDFIGRVLHYIIVRSFQTGEYKIGSRTDDDQSDSDSDNDLEELDQQ